MTDIGDQRPGTAQIGVTGMAVHNRSNAKTEALIAEHGTDGDFVPATSAAGFVASLEVPRKIIIMVKAGGPTDAVIDELSALMDPGDILVDGGNALFEDTRRREEALRSKGIHFVGCGISGGEEGALNGPSMMPGGSAQSYESLGPILERISAQVDGEPAQDSTASNPDVLAHVGSDTGTEHETGTAND
jgi:6-phosphogluconate dehydrogenase